MYTQFYGLREKPFSLSPDPRYLYLSDAHREALAHLLYGIEQGEGFIAVTGEVGTGKTTLSRTLLQRLQAGTEVAFIFNPQLSGTELLEAINAELGLETEGRSRRELHDQLNRFLLTKKREDRRVLLIIDEAQTLSREALEQVRLLSNLETDTEKLLQIILIGQPELDVMLESPDLRQLLQRISVRWQLTPLGANETREYVRHRLRIAAGGPREIFSDLALREVHRRSGGIPRVVNLLCDRTLLAGYASGVSSIGLGLVTQTEQELRRGARSATLGRGDGATRGLTVPRWAAVAALATLVAVGSFAWYLTRSSSPAVASPERAAPGPPPTVARREVAAPPPGRSLEALLAETADLPDPQSVAALDTTARPAADLGTLIARASPAATTATALDAVLLAWGSPPVQAELLSLGQALAALRAQGLAVLPLRGTSADVLRALDQPALLVLSALDGAPRSVVLRHLGSDGEAELLGLGSGPRRLSFEEVARHWDGEAYVVWKDFEGLPPVIGPGSRGAPVAWLQHTLGRLGHFTGTPNGEFDLETVSAVRALQASSALRIDGTVGPETKIHLYQAMGDYVVPRLGSGTGAASGPHVGPERS